MAIDQAALTQVSLPHSVALLTILSPQVDGSVAISGVEWTVSLQSAFIVVSCQVSRPLLMWRLLPMFIVPFRPFGAFCLYLARPPNSFAAAQIGRQYPITCHCGADGCVSLWAVCRRQMLPQSTASGIVSATSGL